LGARSDRRSFADLRERIVSGLVMAAAASVPLLLGGPLLTVFVAAVAAAAGWEFRRLTLAVDDATRGWSPWAVSALFAAAVVVAGSAGLGPAVALLAAGAAGAVALDLARGAVSSWRWAPAGFLGFGLAACCFVALRDIEPFGLATVLWVSGVVVAADTGAFFAGRVIGGPKLWPSVSPKKTWAGLAGAVVAAAAVGAAFSGATTGTFVEQVSVVSAVAALVAQAGDLAESALKRRFGAKDSSGLIPGHGGVLDRLDGMSAATLVAAAVTFARGEPVFVW
jgi:phosphatidate cytidylyltransferase